MKKRLRKKKHLAEFRQLGFSLVARLREALDEAGFDSFCDAFVSEAIEANGLCFGGGGGPDTPWAGVVARDHRHDSTDDQDQEAVSKWLSAHPDVVEFRLSGHWDLWYGIDPFDEAPSRG